MGDRDIELVASDGAAFAISTINAKLCNLIKTVLDEDSDAAQVPLPNVSSDVLGLVVEYLNHHAGAAPNPIAAPLRSANIADCAADPWDAAFCERVGADPQLALSVILAANYLDCTPLLQLGCAQLAALCRADPDARAQILPGIRAIMPQIVPLVERYLNPAKAGGGGGAAAGSAEDAKRPPPTVASVSAALGATKSIDELVRVIERQLELLRAASVKAGGAVATGIDATPKPAEAAGPWQCESCTYVNDAARRTCDMCGTKK